MARLTMVSVAQSHNSALLARMIDKRNTGEASTMSVWPASDDDRHPSGQMQNPIGLIATF
jgi:hypothetical protein